MHFAHVALSLSLRTPRIPHYLPQSPDVISLDLLTQVNTNGFLVGDDELYAAQGDTLDLMRLVGADGWPKKSLYAESANELVSEFGRARGYDEHDLGMLTPTLKELLHEESASYATSWTRIFPPPSEPALADDLLRQGPGYATDLDEATRDFLRWRETAGEAVRRLVNASAVIRTAEAHERDSEGEN